MLFSNKLLKNALVHFPRWMDIRKRYFSSTGGLFLNSISDEVEEIQNKINEYVNTFFIPYYQDKVEIIPDFIYKANIGYIDTQDYYINILEPSLTLTEDIKKFYSSDEYAYYQDGYLFVKNNVATIKVQIEELTLTRVTEKMHVWNAYDEFAAFIGIKRYQDETNKDLYNRIIYTSNRVINSSNDGLINAIQASLINIIPELTSKDIILEKPTAENLNRYYDEYELVLDKLSKINKDVLKNKEWDKDLWKTDFKEIDYIPNLWDISLNSYENGIGDNNDLQSMLISDQSTTDVELSFYEKKEEALYEYVKNNDIEDKLTLTVSKYNNILNPLKANYKIVATEALEINELQEQPITFELYKSTIGEHTRRIEDILIVENATKDVEIINQGIIEPNKYYKAKFIPKNKYDSMEIYECYVTNGYERLSNYLDNTLYNNFTFKGDMLYNSLTKINADRLYQFEKYENVIDTSYGITMEDISKISSLTLDTSHCSNEMIKIIYDCQQTTISNNDITLNNFYYNIETKEYISDTVVGDKSLSINIVANEVQFKISQGNCNVITMINGQFVDNITPVFNNGDYLYKTKKYSIPQKFEIIVISLGQSITKVHDLLFSKYEISLKANKGIATKDENDDSVYYLPQDTNNSVTIIFRTYTQFAPIIKKIYGGRPLDESCFYITNLIHHTQSNIQLVIKSNCFVELYESDEEFDECSKLDDNIKFTIDYSTDKLYKALSNDAYIIIDVSNYSIINSITLKNGVYETISNSSNKFYMIRLAKNQAINEIIIDGSYNEKLRNVTLNSIISKKIIGYNPTINNDKLYVNKLTENLLLVRKDGSQHQLNILFDDFNVLENDISLVKITNLPDNLQATFIIKITENDYENTYSIISLEKAGVFDKIYFYPKGSKEYIAYNECVTYLYEKNDLEIINTFNNGYNENTLMMYQVQPLSKDCNITFQNDNDWSLSKSKLKIKFNVNFDDNNLYNITQKTINEYIKLENIVPLKEIYIGENKETIELAQYTINTNNENFEVIYNTDITDESNKITEYIDVNKSGFNKLKYANILSVAKIVSMSDSDETVTIIPTTDYQVLKEKGIIVWSNKELLNSNKKLYIIYTIKRAIAIKYSQEYLYKKVQYSVEAYNKQFSTIIKNINNGNIIDLNNPSFVEPSIANSIKNNYKNNCIVYVQCDNPAFTCEKINDLLVFKKIYDKDIIAVKTGWYYLYGREYYMFATNDSKNINESEYTLMEDVEKEDGKLLFHKRTVNYVKNSKMLLSSFANTYYINDFNKIQSLIGVSNLNRLTACDTYNGWQTFSMNISLDKGLNGLGLYFKPMINSTNSSYAILDITSYIFNETNVSFYNPHKAKVYLGIDNGILKNKVTNSISISSAYEITSNNGDFYDCTFTKDNLNRYYLIVTTEGLIDDIIIQDEQIFNINNHKKNISILNLNIEEEIAAGINKRLFIENTKGNNDDGTEFNYENCLVNKPMIDWDITRFKKYSVEKDWVNEFKLTNINVSIINDKDCIVSTGARYGKIISKPIYIKDPKIINRIIYKINDVPFINFKGFSCTLSQSKTPFGSYIPCKLEYSNEMNINATKDISFEYIQLSIDIPPHKAINNLEIYIEYKSNDLNYPSEITNSNGIFISKILDTYATATYQLKDINLENIYGNNIIEIRAAREGSEMQVWTEWKHINVKDDKLLNNIIFENYRFFQIRITLPDKNSKIKINYIELEVIN